MCNKYHRYILLFHNDNDFNTHHYQTIYLSNIAYNNVDVDFFLKISIIQNNIESAAIFAN